MRDGERTAWHRPEVTVLVRSRAEEAVLAACKGNQTTAGPGKAVRRRCRSRNGNDCRAVTAS